VVTCEVDASGLGKGPVPGSCEHGNETSGFHKRWGISWLAEWLLDSQEGLLYMELVMLLEANLCYVLQIFRVLMSTYDLAVILKLLCRPVWRQ
jgi:hypothetical protein